MEKKFNFFMVWLTAFTFIAGVLAMIIFWYDRYNLLSQIDTLEQKMQTITSEQSNLQSNDTKLTEELKKINNIQSNLSQTSTMQVVEDSAIISATEKATPAVVSIIESKEIQTLKQGQIIFDPFTGSFYIEKPRSTGSNKVKVGGGSGFIFDKSGLILTNAHVVADENAIYTVILSNGKQYNANILMRANEKDIAILKIEPNQENPNTEFPVLEFGDIKNIKIGQRVIAIGNALAEFQNTVTTGILSAKNRSIVENNTNSIAGLLQTDAAINPGNSGGPLLSLDAKVIGINTAIANNAEGIGFAIPIDTAMNIIEMFKKYGKYTPAYLGIQFSQTPEGNVIIDVMPGSPADQAGILANDLIVKCDGESINEKYATNNCVLNKFPGDTLNLTINRNGEEKNIEIKLTERPDLMIKN